MIRVRFPITLLVNPISGGICFFKSGQMKVLASCDMVLGIFHTFPGQQYVYFGKYNIHSIP